MDASSATWEGLSPPYPTIVADPPWEYRGTTSVNRGARAGQRLPFLPYTSMTVGQIAGLPVKDLAADDAHLYLWTTSRYLRDAHEVAEAWGFRPAQVLVWCKAPVGVGPGGAFTNTAEFIIFARRGHLSAKMRYPTTWWEWGRGGHSAKPPAFLDVVEQVSPGPYVELFARQPRLGWDSWGWGYEQAS